MDSQIRLTNALLGQRVSELIRLRLRFAPAASDGAAVIAGDRALVTRLHHASGSYHALRVAAERHQATDWPRHYAAISDALPPSVRSFFPKGIATIDGGITIAGAKIPAVLMEWIDGPTLFEAADHAASERNNAVLLAMAESLRELSVALGEARVTHGDLSPDNLMMRSTGELVCIDLDTLQWPGMRVRSRQEGSPTYRHPRPGATPRHLDAYAALVIYTSLTVLADAPELRETVGHAIDVHGGALLFSSWDLADPGTSRAFSLARERAGTRSRHMLDLLIRASESEPYRTPELLAEAFATASESSQQTTTTQLASGAQETKAWDLSEVIDRLRTELGETDGVAPRRDAGLFAQTWPTPEEPDVSGWDVSEPEDIAVESASVSALEREESLAERYREKIAGAARRNDDVEIARLGREAERRELPLGAETQRLVRVAGERISIRNRLERALRENDRSGLAELAQSGELVILGDTDRHTLTRVLQALEWPGLLRAIEADDDAVILAWYDEELFGSAEALPTELRARVELARARTRWVEEIRALLKKRDARTLEALIVEEPEDGLNQLSRGERARVLRLIEQRSALNDLHAGLRDADNTRILTALNVIERVGARIENPATWAAVQGVLERATIIEQIVDAAEADPPDDRQLAHLLPVAKRMGLAHDPALKGPLAFDQLEGMVVRGAALRRIRQAIASDDDQMIRRAAYPDVTGALELLTEEERDRVEVARSRRGIARATSR